MNEAMQLKVNQMVRDMRGIGSLELEVAIAKELVRAGWVKSDREERDRRIEDEEALGLGL